MMEHDEDRPLPNNEIPQTTGNKSHNAFFTIVEIPLFLCMVGMTIAGTAISNILLYRTCVHSLNYSNIKCQTFLAPERVNTTHALEQEVQQYATFVSTVKSVIESLLPAILSLFLGVWSDTYGRKPLIVWPMLGFSVSAMIMVVYSMLEKLGPWWFILTSIPLSLSGSFTATITGAYCYLNDITNDDNRSLRMTVLGASLSAGSIIGLLVSSQLLKAVGNVYLLLIVCGILVASYAYANVFLMESLPNATQGGFSKILDVSFVKEMAKKCFKRRPNNGRAQILLLTFANCLTVFIMYGLDGLEYMYTRERLRWSMKDYNIYSATNTFISFAGAFIGMGLMQSFLGLSDLTTANVALLSGSAEYVVKMLAANSWNMYLAALIALFKGLTSPLIRSFMTKVLPGEDISKVFTLMSAIEGLCPLISPVLYNSLYAFSISNFPGAIFVLSTGISALCVTMLGIVQCYRWRVPSTYQAIYDEEIS